MLRYAVTKSFASCTILLNLHQNFNAERQPWPMCMQIIPILLTRTLSSSTKCYHEACSYLTVQLVLSDRWKRYFSIPSSTTSANSMRPSLLVEFTTFYCMYGATQTARWHLCVLIKHESITINQTQNWTRQMSALDQFCVPDQVTYR